MVYDNYGVKIREDIKIPGIVNTEGKYAGFPVLFLNIFGCNLNCMYYNDTGDIRVCHNHKGFQEPDYIEMETEELFDYVSNNLYEGVQILYIRGGEPYQQAHPIQNFCSLIRSRYADLKIIIETNGLVQPTQGFANSFDLISIKCHLNDMIPTQKKHFSSGLDYDRKLESYQNSNKNKIDKIQYIINDCYGDMFSETIDTSQKKRLTDFEFKFYVDKKTDIYDIIYVYQNRLSGIDTSDIFVIPFYKEMESINFNNYIINAVVDFGWRMSYKNRYEEYDSSEFI